MNNFSSFQSQLFRGGVNINSFGYVNKYSYGITLDPSGTDYVELVDAESNTMPNAYQINATADTSNTFLEVDLSDQFLKASDFLPNNTTDTTIYLKYKHNSASTSENIFSHLFSQLFYHIKFTDTSFDSVNTIEPGQSFDVHYLVGGADTITYSISGVLDSGSLPETGYLVSTYEKKTITLGSDASSGIIDFFVNDVSTNAQVYVPFRYTVTVGDVPDPNDPDQFATIAVFYIDGVAQKSIEQSPGIHYFDLGHSSMDGKSFAFSDSPDDTTDYTDVSAVGIPGQAGAYLRIITDTNTQNLYYHDGSTAGMGGSFVNFGSYDYVYTVKVVTNDVGKDVYAIDVNGDGVFYNQPNISFNGGFKYLFDVADSTNDPYTLTFGTVVDGTGEESYISRSNGKVLLDLTTYVESEPFRYFEDSSAGMGYKPSHIVKTTTNILGDAVFSIQKIYTEDFYTQPDMSFNVGEYHEFDITDSTMSDISLVFGTVFDNSASILTDVSFIRYTNDRIVLDLRDYTGETLYYFEDTTANMGYRVIERKLPNTNLFIENMSATTNGKSLNRYRPTSSSMLPSIVNDRSLLIPTYSRNGLFFDNNGNTKINYITYQEKDNLKIGNNSFILSFMVKFISNVITGGHYSNNASIFAIYYKSGTYGATKGFQFVVIQGSNKLNFYNGGINRTTGISIPHNEWCKITIRNNSTNMNVSIQTDDSITEESFNHTFDYGEIDYIIFGGIINSGSLNQDIRYDIYSLKNAYLSDINYYIGSTEFPELPPVVEKFTVTISNEQIYLLDDLDGTSVPKDPLNFNVPFVKGITYKFDQSDTSNAGNTLVLGTVPDSSTNLIDYQTVVGTPGQPGAYTSFTASGETVYYYSFETPDMGYKPVLQLNGFQWKWYENYWYNYNPSGYTYKHDFSFFDSATVLDQSEDYTNGPYSNGTSVDGTNCSTLTNEVIATGFDLKSGMWHAYFIPVNSGLHTFELQSDNGSILWILNHESDPWTYSNKLVEVTDTNHSGVVSRTINLNAGQPYFIRFIYGDEIYGDQLRVRFQDPLGSLTTDFTGYLYGYL